MIKKIISGGQTGADENGLKAAKKVGLATGGWMPKGWATLDGPKPKYAELYGMQEHISGYSARTEANVMASDGTVRFASNFKSSGEVCTLRAIQWHRKPYIDIDINNPISVSDFYDWIIAKNIKTLNVAGNSEQNSPGIGSFVLKYLAEFFDFCGEFAETSEEKSQE